MPPRTQIALDRIPLERAVDTATAIAPYADWIEVGTSLIKEFGMAAVRRVAAAADGTPVLADLKTADDAAYEFTLAFDAGAASATVLGLAADATIDTAARIAAERSAEAVVDLMETDEERRAALAARLPAEVVLAAHLGKDTQPAARAAGAGPAGMLGDWARGRRIAVAGGLTAQDLPAFAGTEDVRVIVGSAVTRAEDPVAAARHLAEAAARAAYTSRT